MSTQATGTGRIERLKTMVRKVWGRTVKFGWLRGLGVLILGAIIAMILQAVWDARKSHPFVAVILSNDDPNFTIPMELKRGIQAAMANVPSISTPDQQSVEVRFVQSSLTPTDTAQAVRRECLDVDDCIAIVGASDSTTTAATLAEILRSSAAERPTLIMPIATATSLTETAGRAHFSQILRLVPNNDDQGQQIKSFIASRARTQRVMVIVDPANPEYSRNLAQIIVQAVRDNGGDATRVEYRDSQTMAEANRSSLGDRDFIVFVGTSSHGLDIIQDMIRLGIRVPIIFTDGNTVQEVINQSLHMPGPAYFLTPVAQLNNFREPGYTAIGRDTHAILLNIFSQSHQLTRRDVAQFVSEHKYDISLEPGAAGRYRFGADGENSFMHFKIFSVENGQVRLQDGF
ncbi:MAG: hypothetical protein QOG13_3309 [Sphingomonadales bacterium]|nr:hypothetical protein [Sphingomonadales bacterium]